MRLLSLIALVSVISLAKQPDVVKLVKKSAEDKPLTTSFNVDKIYVQSGAVDISGEVTLPLYDGAPSSINSYVEITLESGDKHLFAVDPLSAGVWITEDYAKEVGAKLKNVHSAGAKAEVYKIAKIPGFTAGDVKFNDLTAFATYSPDYPDVPVAGLIGLQTFPELSAALLLSKGELHLAPASAGATMLAAVPKGTQLSYTEIASERIKDGRDMKWINGRRPVAVQGKLDGKDVLVTLSAAGHDYASPGGDGVATRDVLVGKKPGRKFGVAGHYYSELTLGSLPAMTLDLIEGPNQELTRWHWQVLLDAPVTGRWDMAYDPANHTLAVAEAPQIARSNWLATLVANTEKGFDPNPETGEPPKPKDQAGVWSSLLDIREAGGDFDAALEAANKALENDPDSCANELGVGEVLLFDFGRYAEAEPHLRNAAEMYDTWMELSLSERQQVQQDKGKAEKDGGIWDGPIPQPHSCATAWGRVAHAQLALGHPDAVLQIYKEHEDLNWRLPILAGNALLSEGRTKEAEAAYRQALRLAGANSPAPSLALAMILADNGRMDDANANFMDAIFGNGSSLAAARAYAEAQLSHRGPVAAEAAMANLFRANPDMPQLALAQAELLLRNGKDASGPIAEAIKGYEYALRLYRYDSELRSGYAAALRLAGRAADAEAQAQRAIRGNPSQGLAMLVLADLAKDAGDDAKAAEWHSKAVLTDADVPTMARYFAMR